MFNSIKFIDCYLNLKTFEQSSVAIITPSAFRIKTEKDLTEELVALKTNKVPDVFLSEATNELAMKRFSGNPLSKKIFEVISTIDPLFTKDIAEKTQLSLGGIITKEMFIRSTMAFSVLNSIAQKLSTQVFIEKTTDEILALFNEAIKPFLPTEEISLFDSNGNSTGTNAEEQDIVGKLPLALQQLGLARQRAFDTNDLELSKKIGDKMDEILAKL